MSILRNKTGKVRLFWKLAFVIVLYMIAAVLVRFIPISLLTIILVNGGMSQANALEKANSLIVVNPYWSTLISIISGILSLLIVWYMTRVVEKIDLTGEALGLNWNKQSLWLSLLGAILAFLFFVASFLTDSIINPNRFSVLELMKDISIPIVIQNLFFYLGLGFGEEIVFRGYVQIRLIERWRTILGIVITAVLFVLLHQVSYNLSPIIILSGVMLWTSVGALYYLSKSLYFVIVFHGLLNTLHNTFNYKISDVSNMIINAGALVIITIFYLWLRKTKSHLNAV